ncbi:pentapeptide repeat-containing protein [Streptomyces himalayensis]|uniref:Pentapeptide repeat-containing protein n=1 Tax=Streptomyces himalayensis subsp. himalayensis TaxID=2756131 RepID=A0A7W0IBX9_9ACTN|nr:pentapeptide repeat-containing protein [Streptomyces himalayensis]MBA2949596.1 pentapeptide repeat-containing protein [Streptomyces himalayensis subsp. himalayensis]
MRSNLARRRAERRGLRLWPVGPVLALAFTTAIAVAAAVFFAGWDLLGVQGLKPEHRLTSKTLFDLVKLSFGVVAGAGALVALVVAYRRQRVDEDGALREATRLHTERFTTAVSQLGEESAAVRLGGVHALAGLADDAPTRELRQTCIDVLCAYLRLPYTAEADLPSGDADARHAYLALREVRYTVIRLIRDHFRLAPEHPHSWQGHDLDFTDVVFDGGDFSGAEFSGGTVRFDDATFSGGTVDFKGATFSGGTVDFTRARFSGGTVDFRYATFSGGWVDFWRATFSGGTVFFTRARFSGSAVSFIEATFSGGTVHFRDAPFSGGTVDFKGATFSGGTVDFNGATFSDSSVYFIEATFSGGTVHFRDATFSGDTVFFTRARFSGGTVDFTRARFSGAILDFSGADGVAPSDLVPASGQPLPTGLLFPPAWYPTTP